MASAHAPPERSAHVSRLMFYFGLMYFCEGVCQIGAILSQPIRAYLREMNYGADQTAKFFFVAHIPWIIKPLYGLISDFVPLFGYHRRSYLMLLNLTAAGGFLWMAGMTDVRVLTLATVVVGIGVAAADVIVDALMIEVGQETGLVARFQGVQWISVNVASVLASLGSAAILHSCGAPRTAVRIAALCCVLLPLVVAACTWWAVDERKSRLNVPQFKESARGLMAAFKSPSLLAVVGFLALLAANPGLYTPMNYHLTEVLHVSDAFVALTDSFSAVGRIIGAGLFLAFVGNKVSMRSTLVIGILANAISMLPFFFVRGEATSGIAYFVFGIGYQLGNLAMLTLAAEACPKRAEAFVFAAMMSVMNYALQYGDVLGSRWYEGLFHHHVMPLVAISIGLSLAALPIVPLLPLRRPTVQAAMK